MTGPLVLSLFPGLGLLDLAVEMELPDACIVRGPDLIYNSLSDVRRFHPPADRFDGIVGGPPCQAFSQLRYLQLAQGRQPRFGNLIPEFERCVAEAQPAWFLMENVSAAPLPAVPGYIVRSYRLNNRWVVDAGGIGAEQNRLRVFSFGTPDGRELRIEFAALEAPLSLPCLAGNAYTPEQRSVTSGSGFAPVNRVRGTVSGKPFAPPAVTTGHAVQRSSAPGAVLSQPVNNDPVRKRRASMPGAVSSAHGSLSPRSNAAVVGSDGGRSVRMSRYGIAEACRLQGLPEDFLDGAPFTVEGKLRAIAQGVPLPLGRALARAVAEAMGLLTEAVNG